MNILRILVAAFLASILGTSFATSVPGSGVDEFILELAIVWGGLGVAGIFAGYFSSEAKSPVLVKIGPPILALIVIALISPTYQLNGDIGIVVLGFIPYALCYVFGKVLGKLVEKN